jgi:large subunit ribosomal protein L15
MLDLSTLSPSPGSRRKRKRVGRGPSSGHGKTSGRGHNGQKSRSGYSRRFGFEGGQTPVNRRLPKRGFTHMERHLFAEVNLDVLNDNFNDGDEVTTEALVQKAIVKDYKGGVKVLGRGEITKKLSLKVNAISQSAKDKIEGAGGSVSILEVPVARAVKNRTQGKKAEAK